MLPMVVLAWAILAVLGGVSMPAEHANVADKAAEAGMGICAITVALVVGVGVRRLRETPFPGAKRVFWRDSFRVVRPAAYEKPPSFAPSLEVLQVLRT
jgi:hypothetical protein